MRLSPTLKAIGAALLIGTLTSSAFAGVVKNASSTNIGVDGGCQYYIACIIGGVIQNGPAQEACNNGIVKVIKQCQRK